MLETSLDLMHWLPDGKALHVRNSELPFFYEFSPQEIPENAYFRLAALPSPVKTTAHMLREDGPHDYVLKATPPAHLSRDFGKVGINNKRAALGRVLFHDRRLSRDNSISCASCHQPEHAFADNAARSTGHLGGLTKRNTISLQHVRSYLQGGKLFWDGRTDSLEIAVLEPISHAEEMGLPVADFLEKIRTEPYYQELFTAAYQSPAPTQAKVGQALADFIESTVSFRSKYDVQAAFDFGNFSPQEKRGKAIFSQSCAQCHPLGTFTTGGFANNGLGKLYKDRGRAELTGNPADEGVFRIPSLRQVGLTAPYMHDGRFATLRQVIDFYNRGAAPHPNLTPPLTSSPMNLSESDKQELEAFLNTLSDASTQSDPAYSDPFRTD